MFVFKAIIAFFYLSTSLGQDHDHGHHHGDGHTHHHKAAGVIRGQILDDLLEEPKAYANVSIVKAGSDDIIAGGMSDENGIFLIDKIPFGRYFLVIQYIGYEDMILDDIIIKPHSDMQVDMGVIRINPRTLVFEGVSVVDKLAPVIEDIAKTTYPVAETARAEGGSADDLLETLPSITLDSDGNVSLRGNSNVTILIDGRKSQLSVDMLNANMIEKVEVMTTPSAKFDPDGMAGIINIVLSKNEFVGRSGNLNVNLAERNGRNLSGTFNSFKNDWNIFTSYSVSEKHRQGRNNRNTIKYDLLTDGELENIKSKEYSEKYPKKNNLKMGIEHYPSDKGLLAFDLTYIENQGVDTTNVTSETTTPPDMTPVHRHRETIESEDGNDLNYGIGYFIDDKETKKTFSIQFDYDDHETQEITIYNEDNILESKQVLNDDGIERVFRVDYSAPIENSFNDDAKYEVGFKSDLITDTHFAEIQTENFDWIYDNSISAAYANVLYNFTDRFGMQIGTRFEDQEKKSIINYDNPESCDSLDNDADCNDNGFCNWDTVDESCSASVFSTIMDKYKTQGKFDTSYDHTRVYPSLYFLYNTMGSGNIKFELGRRINRPGHWNLDPIPNLDEVGSNFIRRGNPNLIPEDIYKSEISYSHRLPIGFLKTAIYYSEVTDKIDRDKTTECFGTTCDVDDDDTDQNDYMVLTWENVSKAIERGIDFTFMTKPLPNWDLMLNGNYWDNNLYGEQDDQKGNEYGFWGMMNSTIRLKNDQQVGLYSHFSSPMILTSGEIKSMKRLDLTYKKKVNKRFNFTLKLKDVFDNSGWGIITDQIVDSNADEIDDYRERLIVDSRRNKRNLSITFEYRFGDFQKKKYRREGGHGHSHGGEGMDAGF